MIIYQHSLEELRRRIGTRADHLVSAVGRGGTTAMGLLERETGADIGLQDMKAGRTINTVLEMDGVRWVAHRLSIRQRLPDTVMEAIPGRRLGDVLASEHNGDMVVTSAAISGVDDDVLEIHVRPTLIGTDDLPSGGPVFRLMLVLATLRAYATAPAYRGLGGGMTDLVMSIIAVIMLAAAALTVDMLLPDHTPVTVTAAAVVAAATFLWPARDWRDRVRLKIRGRG